MSADWQSMLLGDFVELKRGYDLPKKQRTSGEVPLVSSSGVSDTHGEAKVAGPGVVTGRYGTIGEVFYIEDDFWPLNTTLYVRDFKGNDPRFVYYFLKTIDYLQYSDKAAVPGVNRNHLHTAEILVPTNTGEQERIAKVLAVLDDKIQLNHQINQTLEQMAQAIFKSWFVDFEPVKAKIAALDAGGSEEDALLAAMQAISGKDADQLARMQAEQPEQYAELRATAELFPAAMQASELGEIPEGWEVYPILEVCDLLGGAQPPASAFVSTQQPDHVRLLQIRDFTNDNHLTYVPDTKKLRKASEDDILIGRYGSASGDRDRDSLGRICRGKAGAYNVALMKLSPIRAGREFCLQLFSSRDFYNYLRGTSTKAVQSGFSKKELKQYLVCLPPENLRTAYEHIGENVWGLVKNKTRENEMLASLRDTLLPKLLSGELSLPDAETELQEAAHA